MSETVLFNPKIQDSGLVEPEVQRGFSVNYSFFDDQKLLPAGERVSEHKHIGLSFYRTFLIGDSLNKFAAISGSIGLATGADASIKILDPVYLTASYSFPEHSQLALPIRLLQNQSTGLSISPVYRNQIYRYNRLRKGIGLYSLGPNSRRSFISSGIKTSLFIFLPPDYPFELNPVSTRQPFLSLSLEAGKLIRENSVYFLFGFKIGSY